MFWPTCMHFNFGSQDKVSEAKQEIAYIEKLVSTERELEELTDDEEWLCPDCKSSDTCI